MPKVKREGLLCLRCDHEWLPKFYGVMPFRCPSCKSCYWDTLRRKKKVKK